MFPADQQPGSPVSLAAFVRRVDHDRYLMAGFAPVAARPALLALIAFNYEIARVREAVSEPMLGQIRLQWWREALDGIFSGAPREHEVTVPLAAAVAHHKIQRAVFERMIDAREADLEDTPPADRDALMAYAADTSGALAELFANILVPGDAAMRERARLVGIAWGLAGILRSVPHHGTQGRVLLPADTLAAQGVSAENVVSGRARAAVRAIVSALAEDARALSYEGPQPDPRARRAAKAMLLAAPLARHYLGRLARAGHDPWDERASSGPLRRLRVLGSASLLGRY